jgi:hypothetical protein
MGLPAAAKCAVPSGHTTEPQLRFEAEAVETTFLLLSIPFSAVSEYVSL